MRKTLSFSAALLALTATAGMAQAEVEYSGNVALTTDYHWRGDTQSSQDFAIQGGFDLAVGGFYAGTWASSIAGDADMELDVYAGYGFEASGVGLDFGVIQYFYPSDGTADLDFLEVYAGVAKDFEMVGLSGYMYYDPDNETIYGEAGVGVSASDALSFDVNIGTIFDDGGDGSSELFNYNFGGTYGVGGFDLDLRYYDKEDGEDNFVFSIGRAM